MRRFFQSAICRCLQLILLATAMPALAQQPENETVLLRLGIGYGQHSSVLYEQDDREFYLLPRLQIYYKKAYLENMDLGFNLFENEHWALDLTGKQSFDALLTRGNGLKDSLFSGLIGLDKPIFMPGGPAALKELITPVKRHFSYLGGATLYFRHDQWLVSQSWHQDMSNVHHGSELQTNISYRYLQDGYGIALTGSVRRIDSDYSNYYFGPNAEDFRQQIYQYQPGAQWLPSVKIAVQIEISQNIDFVANWRREYLPRGYLPSLFFAKLEQDLWFSGVVMQW